jgi:hypothetical protein
MDDETFAEFIRLMKKHWKRTRKWKVVAKELNRWILANRQNGPLGPRPLLLSADYFSNITCAAVRALKNIWALKRTKNKK